MRCVFRASCACGPTKMLMRSIRWKRSGSWQVQVDQSAAMPSYLNHFSGKAAEGAGREARIQTQPSGFEKCLTLRFFFAALRLCVRTAVPKSKSHAKTRRRKDAQSQTETHRVLLKLASSNIIVLQIAGRGADKEAAVPAERYP